MKIKTIELTGAALDWAVAETEGGKRLLTTERRFGIDVPIKRIPPFSTSWNVGGPLIEKHKIGTNPFGGQWQGAVSNVVNFRELVFVADGPTPLVAAMRSLVASTLGEEIDVPDELVTAAADAKA